MIILLFGVSNVGKTTTGRILANKLSYTFYDLDEEVKKYYHATLDQFYNRHKDIEDRDCRRAKLLNRVIAHKDNIVVAITPTSYIKYYQKIIHQDNVLCFYLTDTVENIFNRLVFTDENDNILPNSEEYRNKHKEYYLKDIKSDLFYYGQIYSFIKNKVNIDNKTQDEVADYIINEYL